MENYLPSKKFVLILLAVLLVGGIVAYASNKVFGGKEKITYDKDLSISSTSGSPDRDKDGLPDWEEVLWGTDPSNPTTNAETPDAVWIRTKEEEVIAERTNRTTGASSKEEPNSTDLFLQEFLLSYTKLKTSGTITPDATAYISDTMVASFADQAKIEDIYTITNVITVPSSENATTTYKNSVLALAKKHNANRTLGTELEIFAELLESDTKDTENEAKLLKIATAYKTFAKELMTIRVPENMTSSHVILANDAVRVGTAVEHMAAINKDPLMGLLGLSQYETSSSLLEVDIDALSSR